MIPILIAVGVVVLIIAIILGIAIKYRVVVPTNMVHIVNSSSGRRVYGKDSEYGNTYYAFPDWLPKIGVNVTKFPTSNFGVELKGYDAYDYKRLPFQVDVQAFFVMEDADTVSQRVANFEELRDYLRKIVSGAVRKVTASLPLEQILSARAELAADFDKEVAEQLKDWGVKPVNSIEFMNIQDASGSKVIQDIQKKEESRIDRDSRVTQAENAQVAQTKEIETKRQVELQRQEAEQQIGTRTAQKDQAIGISREQAQQAVAEQAKATAEKDMAVKQVTQTRSAEIEKSVQVTQAEARRDTDIINAEADKRKQELNAEAQLVEDQKSAEGIRAKQQAEADGISAIGKAKAEAESKMQMAPVDAQIALAKEIGENEGYQHYLISLKQVEANAEVGKEQAKALEAANIQIISGGGSTAANAGLNLGALLTNFIATDTGKAVFEAVVKPKAKDVE